MLVLSTARLCSLNLSLNHVVPETALQVICFTLQVKHAPSLHTLLVQSNLDYPDSLGPDEIVRIIEGPDHHHHHHLLAFFFFNNKFNRIQQVVRRGDLKKPNTNQISSMRSQSTPLKFRGKSGSFYSYVSCFCFCFCFVLIFAQSILLPFPKGESDPGLINFYFCLWIVPHGQGKLLHVITEQQICHISF